MLEVTNTCNLKCDYCFRSKWHIHDKEISWETFLKIKERINFAESVCLCGMGEQLLHSRFYDMIEALEDKNVLIITNGTIPINYDKLSAKGNVSSITFSVDGPSEEIMLKSCLGYKFSNLLDNLKRSRGYSSLTIGINCVISPHNLDAMPSMVRFCSEYGVKVLNLLLPTYNMRWVKRKAEQIKNTMEEVYIVAQDHGIKIKAPGEMNCVFEKSVIPFITLSGDVRPCCDHFNRISTAGNLLKNTFEEIWDSPTYRKFKSAEYCFGCVQNQKVI
jgi:MoaA/NifB/PqqE/SkfB family radical SAM enzyme